MKGSREARGARASLVPEEWLARLPAEKEKLFVTTAEELEASYAMLSVALNEAFSLRTRSTLAHAREQVRVSADLFDRLTVRLLAALRALGDQGRHSRIFPNVVALNPGFFRSANAQHIARTSNMLSMVLFITRFRFSRKLRALAAILEKLMADFREVAAEIADGASIRPGAHWGALEILHYDVNTCLRETMVTLKSFLCALPNEEVQSLQQKLQTSELLPFSGIAPGSS